MHFQETAVEHDQTFLCIEHQEAVRHVPDLNCQFALCRCSRRRIQRRGLGPGRASSAAALTGLRLHPVLMLVPPAPNPKAGDEHDQDAAGRLLEAVIPGGAAPTLQGRVSALRRQDEQRIVVECAGRFDAHLAVDPRRVSPTTTALTSRSQVWMPFGRVFYDDVVLGNLANTVPSSRLSEIELSLLRMVRH